MTKDNSLQTPERVGTSAKCAQESEKVDVKANTTTQATKASVKLTQRDIAGILKIDTKTLYNWRKHKPELYAVVMLGFKFKELLERQKSYTKELESIEQNLDERLRLP